MGTVRVAKRRRFTQVDQATVNDQTLSFRARGVLVWLLDKPDDWRCDSLAITRAGTEGRDAIRAALNELEEHGYLVRNRFRDAETGQWGYEAVVFETPQSNPLGRTCTTLPKDGSPGVGEPGAGFPGDKNKDYEQELIPTPVVPTGGTVALVAMPLAALARGDGFDEFWSAYPWRVGKVAAKRAWERSKKSRPELSVVLAAVATYRESDQVRRGYVAHPATWLNQGRWDDESGPARTTGDQDVWVRAAQNMGLA